MRRTAVLAAALALAVPSSAVAASALEESTKSAVSATIAFQKKLRKAAPGGDARNRAVARKAQGCLPVLRKAPKSARSDLFNLYFNALSGAYWKADRAIFTNWIGTGLNPAAKRHPLWKARRTGLLRSLKAARGIYGVAVVDICPVARRWSADGFKASERPAEITRLLATFRKLGDLADDGGSDKLDDAIDRYGGRYGPVAKEILDEGVDEDDSRVIKDSDPVARVLSPDG